MLRRINTYLLTALLLISSAAHAQDDNTQRPVRRVFVPVEDLDAVLNRDHKGVLLPVDEFEQLESLAAQNAARNSQHPRGTRSLGRRLQRPNRRRTTAHHNHRPLHQLQRRLDATRDPRRRTRRRKRHPRRPARPHRPLPQWRRQPPPLHQPNRAALRHDRSLLHAQCGRQRQSRASTPSPHPPGSSASPCQRAATSQSVASRSNAPPRHEPATTNSRSGVVSAARDGSNSASQTDNRPPPVTPSSSHSAFYVAPGEVTWRAVTSPQVFGRIDPLVCSVPNSLEITDIVSNGLESWNSPIPRTANAPKSPSPTASPSTTTAPSPSAASSAPPRSALDRTQPHHRQRRPRTSAAPSSITTPARACS